MAAVAKVYHKAYMLSDAIFLVFWLVNFNAFCCFVKPLCCKNIKKEHTANITDLYNSIDVDITL